MLSCIMYTYNICLLGVIRRDMPIWLLSLLPSSSIYRWTPILSPPHPGPCDDANTRYPERPTFPTRTGSLNLQTTVPAVPTIEHPTFLSYQVSSVYDPTYQLESSDAVKTYLLRLLELDI
jgi:hypothetical protein